MLPSRSKLKITVISTGLARDTGGGCQQLSSLAYISRRLSTRSGADCADAIEHDASSSAAANQIDGLRRSATLAHLMSDATCTFTILSGSVTAPPDDPGGAFFSLST